METMGFQFSLSVEKCGLKFSLPKSNRFHARSCTKYIMVFTKTSNRPTLALVIISFVSKNTKITVVDVATIRQESVFIKVLTGFSITVTPFLMLERRELFQLLLHLFYL